MAKTEKAPAAPPARSAREVAAKGETPEQTVTRYIRQLHRQVGLPFNDDDAAQLNAAIQAIGSRKPDKEPAATGDEDAGK